MMRRGARSWLLVSTLSAIALSALRGCGGDGGTSSSLDGGPTGVISTDSGKVAPSDADVADESFGDAGLSGIPVDLDGWVPFNDYDPSCGFYVPAPKAPLPSPIAWKPCDVGVVPTGVVCREMVIDWGANGTLEAFPGAAFAQPSGDVTLTFDRLFGPTTGREATLLLVAEADGPVHQALLETGGTCAAAGGAVYGQHVVVPVADSEVGNQLGKSGGGALGGDIDGPPTVLLHFHDTVRREAYAPGPSGFLEDSTKGRFFHSWASPMTTSVPVPMGIEAFYVGEDIFADGVEGDLTVDSYSADAGARMLLGYPSDSTRGVFDFSTDGKDMFWLDATGVNLSSGSPPAAVDIMTAPYTTDPSALVKRRLRSAGFWNYGQDSKVGCGYAANDTFDQASGMAGLRIIRLADGVSWRLMLPGLPALQWQEVLAITCNEVFAILAVKGGKQVVRVRLDSLVNPEAPN